MYIVNSSRYFAHRLLSDCWLFTATAVLQVVAFYVLHVNNVFCFFAVFLCIFYCYADVHYALLIQQVKRIDNSINRLLFYGILSRTWVSRYKKLSSIIAHTVSTILFTGHCKWFGASNDQTH